MKRAQDMWETSILIPRPSLNLEMKVDAAVVVVVAVVMEYIMVTPLVPLPLNSLLALVVDTVMDVMVLVVQASKVNITMLTIVVKICLTLMPMASLVVLAVKDMVAMERSMLNILVERNTLYLLK
jgi:hypothetical protein